MVDVHSHILPFVDDGSDSVEKSIEIVKKFASDGVTKILLTPHYKKGIYQVGVEELKRKFEDFKSQVKDSGIGVELYLGQEVFCDSKIFSILKNNEVYTLNGTNYLLIEFDYFNYTDILDYAYNIKMLGYIPIIAHIERYGYLDVDTLIGLRELGALIQVNASSVVGDYGKKFQKKVFATIKSGLVDLVASDVHYGREVSLLSAYKVVSKKFGKKTAEDLFVNNAKVLFKD